MPAPVTATAHVVLFAAPPAKLAPHALRAAFDAIPSFRDALPDVVSPVAALGIAVKAASTDTYRPVHAGQSEGCSRWIFTNADVNRDHARIEGYDGIEVNKGGALRIDSGIPASVAAVVESAYGAARGVVEPSRLNAALATWCGARGQYLRDGSYLLPALDADTASVLAAVVALGGIGAAFAVGGAALASFTAPIERSLEDDVAAVLAATGEVIAKAKTAQSATGATLQVTEGGDLRMAETAHRDLDDVRARLTLWRERLGLAMGDVDAQLSAAEKLLDTECDRALAAVEARKAARKLAREVAALTGAPSAKALEALDEVDAVAAKRAAKRAAHVAA